jgi:cation-transporting ATPase 13A2
MDGYQSSWWRSARYWLACLLSAGVVWLLNLWFFDRVVPWRYKRVDLREAQYVLVVGQVHGAELLQVQQLGDDVEEEALQESPQQMLLGSANADGPVHLPRSSSSSPHGKYINWRHMRFIFSPAAHAFLMQQSDQINRRAEVIPPEKRHTSVAALRSKEIAQRMKSGLTQEQYRDNLVLYGINALILTVPSIPSLLYQEVFHPFYVFQMYSIALWIFEVYYIFAGTIAVIALISIVQTLVETRRRMTELAELARFDCPVVVLRNNQFTTISSTQLVPGDIVQVATGMLPCDLALLEGGAIANESSLTGESVPVTKTAISFPPNRQTSDAVLPLGSDARTTLYSATKILQLKPHAPDAKVLAMVVRTGFTTTKGSLVLSILYPKPSDFRFERQSYKFVAALFALALVGFAISVWQLKVVQDASIQTMIIRGLDLITIVVPPSLPLALSVGVAFALLWLRDELIYCISPSRISMAGKIRTYCFDKTGTLTEESLVFMGVYGCDLDSASSSSSRATFTAFQSPHTRRPSLSVANAEEQMNHIVADQADGQDAPVSPIANVRRPQDRLEIDTTHTIPLSAEVKVAMACCQSLAAMDGALIGDPLEQQTFDAADANLQDTGDLGGYQQKITLAVKGVQQTFGIVQQFEFSSALQRMAVVCTDLDSQQHWAFVKGSPEMMESLCLPATIPTSFRAALQVFAHKGYRVIAIARKEMASIPLKDKNELRAEVEKDLTFIGMILLENKLKVESEPTLQILREAGIRCVMVTGDHSLTAVTVAKECKLIAPGVRIFQSTVQPSSSSHPSGSEIAWIDTEDDSLRLDPLTLRLPEKVLLEAGGNMEYELAVTGTAWKILSESPDANEPNSLFHRVVLNLQIAARMSPDQKAALIAQLQKLGICTGMCGESVHTQRILRRHDVGCLDAHLIWLCSLFPVTVARTTSVLSSKLTAAFPCPTPRRRSPLPSPTRVPTSAAYRSSSPKAGRPSCRRSSCSDSWRQ